MDFVYFVSHNMQIETSTINSDYMIQFIKPMLSKNKYIVTECHFNELFNFEICSYINNFKIYRFIFEISLYIYIFVSVRYILSMAYSDIILCG